MVMKFSRDLWRLFRRFPETFGLKILGLIFIFVHILKQNIVKTLDFFQVAAPVIVTLQ